MVFLKYLFEKVDFDKNQQTITKAWKITQHAKGQQLNQNIVK